MKEPKGVDNKTARQLFITGQIMGVFMRQSRGEHVDPGALDAMLDRVDVDVLQAYVDSKPQGFRYAKQCCEVIQLAKDRKASN